MSECFRVWASGQEELDPVAALTACLPADRSQLHASGEQHESLMAGINPPLRCAQAAATS